MIEQQNISPYLYGSSRLGIKHYGSLEYHIYDQEEEALTVTTLNARRPWYSFSQSDWIKKDKASEFTGATYNLSLDTLRERRWIGRKEYEMTDHLGNVLVTFLDRKTGYGNSSGSYIGFNADVASITDYYPFGMPMEERSVINGGGFRFGWNTHEKVNEIAGIGNHTTALFGEFDTRTGRRWNRDPKPIPQESEYAVNRNNPVQLYDLLGDCPHGEGCTCGQVEPSPAGLLYEAYLGLDAAIFNTMARAIEWTGNGKSGVNIRKETQYGDNGEILGNKVVEKPQNSVNQEAVEAVLDFFAVIPGKPSPRTFGLLLSKPVVAKQNAVQVIKFIQGKGEKAKEVTVALPKGYKEVTSSGKAKVYSNGKSFISPDLDGHKGGTWKMADKEKSLWKKETRKGTYNTDLSKRVDD